MARPEPKKGRRPDMRTFTQIDENKRNVLRFLEDTHSGRFDVIDDLVSPGIVTHGFPGENPDSLEAYRSFFRDLERAFPRMEFSIDHMVAEEDRVAVRFRIRAVHSGDYLGIPATGRTVEFSGMVLYRLEEGRIVETWLHPDNLTLLQQLGVAPEPQAAR
jgi:steroid delta-isomerase-like uncharacterized protein